MTEAETSFKEEEELRLGLEESGAEHDCVEAGCTLSPDSKEIPASPPARRKPLSNRLKELFKKHRKVSIP